MSRVPDLRKIPDLPDEVVQAALDGNLVLFVGAGVSILLGLPSWRKMAKRQLKFLRTNGILNYSELDQLSLLNPRMQLSIASELADENELELDLTMKLTGYSEGNSIYRSINDIGCVCVTTNYDELLAPRYSDPTDGSKTPATVNRICHKEDFLVTHLDTPGTVIHLHGAVTSQETMVVTTKDYLAHYDDPYVQEFLGKLFARKTVLFIGYGLEETEILEHLLRRGSAGDNHERKRFALQGYYMSQKPLFENLHSYYRMSYGVHVIGYIRDHNNFAQQKVILDGWRTKLNVYPPPLASDLERMREVLNGG